jgi:hypothetical protein
MAFLSIRFKVLACLFLVTLFFGCGMILFAKTVIYHKLHDKLLDKGYWNQIESYISTHSEVEFSHSVCPECVRKLYPDLIDDDGNIK